MRLTSGEAEAFKVLKAVVENELGRRIGEAMTDNARRLSMGQMREICETEGTTLSTTVPYHPTSNG